MSSKTALLICSTRFGATEKTITYIAEKLMDEDITSEIINLKDIRKKEWPKPEGYLVFASGIKMAKWTKNALAYLEMNREFFVDNMDNISIFVSCGTAAEKDKLEFAQQEYLYKIFERLNLPKFHSQVFAGIFDFSKDSKYNFLEKSLMRSVAKKEMSQELDWDYDGVNDFRDWDRIDKFIGEIMTNIQS